MGSTKTQSTTTSTPTATPEERQMNQLLLQQMQATAPQSTQLQQNALGLGNQLMTSFNNPTQWNSLIGGITPEQQQSMISEQDRYLRPQLQAQGIYDSGLGATMRMRSATDLANQNAQFNVGTQQNALNLALSGQAQVQQPSMGYSGQLASNLQGLRSITQNQQQTSNPFLNSFYSSLGRSAGTINWSPNSWFSMGGR